MTGGSVGFAEIKDSNFYFSGGTLTGSNSTGSGNTFITGGTVGDAQCAFLSNIYVSGSSITSISADTDGQVYISGGTINAAGAVNGQVFISNGTINTVYVDSDSNSYAAISGGTVQTLDNEGGFAEVTGGSFGKINVGLNNSTTNISGGSFSFIENNSLINIKGTNLVATQTTGPGYTNLNLTGTLLNGAQLHALYQGDYANQDILNFNGHAATITPAPVPEASTVVSFGLLMLLGAGGMFVKARRRSQASAI